MLNKLKHLYSLPLAVGLRIRLGDPLDESISASTSCFTAIPSNELILVCGFWDKSFKCFTADTGKKREKKRQFLCNNIFLPDKAANTYLSFLLLVSFPDFRM